ESHGLLPGTVKRLLGLRIGHAVWALRHSGNAPEPGRDVEQPSVRLSNPSTTITLNAQGRYVRVQLSGTNYLSLAEVQVFGTGVSNLRSNPNNHQAPASGCGTSPNCSW